jgi:hypothetical protein
MVFMLFMVKAEQQFAKGGRRLQVETETPRLLDVQGVEGNAVTRLLGNEL